MHHCDVTVPRSRYRPVTEQRAPGGGVEIKDVRVLKVLAAIVSSVQNHVVIAHHTGASVPCSRDLTTGVDQAPGASDEVELVEVIAVGAIVTCSVVDIYLHFSHNQLTYLQK